MAPAESPVIPTPDQIREARAATGMSAREAAKVIHSTLRTWQDWERGIARMHPGLWELFLLKIGARESSI